jgi:hypothetical protein
VQQPTSGQPGASTGSFKLDTFTVLAIIGAVIVVSAVLQAIYELNDGGDYAVWFALSEAVPLAAIGFLVLVCSLRLGDAPWGPRLLQAMPALGVLVIVASVALAIRDATDEFADTFWAPVNDLFYYIPITIGVAVFLSGRQRADRLLGSPVPWGRILAAVALVVGLIIAINDVSNADSDEFWVFLDSFAVTAGLALFLLALTLEPAQNMTQPQGGQIKVAELLNDARLPNWIALGALAVFIAGILLGVKALDAPSDGLWLFIQRAGFLIGLAVMVLIASRGQIGVFRADHPYMRYFLGGVLVAMFIAGVKFTFDYDSDTFWWFLDEAIELPAYAALAYAMFEASQRPLRVVQT